jgi:hypothetical protein
MEQETRAIRATLEGFKTLNPKPKPFKSFTLEGLKTVCLRHSTQHVCLVCSLICPLKKLIPNYFKHIYEENQLLMDGRVPT